MNSIKPKKFYINPQTGNVFSGENWIKFPEKERKNIIEVVWKPPSAFKNILYFLRLSQ